MLDKLMAVEAKYDELLALLGDATVQADPPRYRTHAKALAEIESVVEKFREYKAVVVEITQAEELAAGDDAEMQALAQEELPGLKARAEALIAEIKILLIPKDPNDEKNVILEIRAGTGGDEAALFAADLFRMYSRYAERQGWKSRDRCRAARAASAGSRKSSRRSRGEACYSRLKYESGVHRVQRVPATEASGRIHTSDGDRGGAARGRGGRHPDRREGPADRHVLLERPGRPERQHDGLGRAHHAHADGPGRVAAGREVADQEQGEGDEGPARAALRDGAAAGSRTSIAKDRRSQVGTGDRSEKIRTYNFPQNRVTDHRINFTTHRLPDVLDGERGRTHRRGRHVLHGRAVEGSDGGRKLGARAKGQGLPRRSRP